MDIVHTLTGCNGMRQWGFQPMVLQMCLLTLRLLMSYIYVYIYIYIYIYMERPFLMFLDHTQRRTTVGRTPLGEWSARRRDLYLTPTWQHTTLTTDKYPCPRWDSNHLSRRAACGRSISMPPVGFEPTISAGERPVAARLLRSWMVQNGDRDTAFWIYEQKCIVNGNKDTYSN